MFNLSKKQTSCSDLEKTEIQTLKRQPNFVNLNFSKELIEDCLLNAIDKEEK